MQTETIKRRLHSVIEEIDDPATLKAVHLLLTQRGEKNFQHPQLEPEQLKELDRRWNDHLNRKSKSFSLPQVKEIVRSRKRG
ncbi:MAG: hypothetical protein ABIQ74_09555 [Chitinophagales bacterium]